MTEVGKRHDSRGRDAHHLLQDERRTARRLQRLGQHDQVERPALEIAQPIVDVPLDDRHPATDACMKPVRGDLDAVSVATAGANQVLHR